MIRWCCYCQRLMGEAPPLTTFEITHGICPPCEVRLLGGENLHAEYDQVRAFYARVFEAASGGDESTCVEIARQGLALGYTTAELLVGMIQPALSEIGERWEKGLVSVDDEHRFTRWCDAMLAVLPRQAANTKQCELLIFQAPGNLHNLGARYAEEALQAWGTACLAVPTELGVPEMMSEIERLKPAWVGFSCALPEMVEACAPVCRALRDAGYQGGLILAGQAIRRGSQLARVEAAIVCPTLTEVRALVFQTRAMKMASSPE